MSIADQLTQLNQVKSGIKQALIDKGVDMADVPFTRYAEKIAGISAGEYPGHQVKKGETGKLSQSNNQTLSGAIPDGIIPLTLKLTHANTNSDWPVYLGLSDEPFAYGKGNIVGASRAGMVLFYDLEMAYGGITEIQKHTYYGCHTTNASGTNTLSIVKWLEPIS